METPLGILRGGNALLNHIHSKDDPYDLVYAGGIKIMMDKEVRQVSSQLTSS